MADRYCTECGAPLGADDKFCPACGAEMKDVDSYTAAADIPGSRSAAGRPGEYAGRLQMLSILTILWGGFALIFAVSVLSSVDTLVNSIVDQLKATSYEGYENMWAYLVANGINEDTFRMIFWAMGGTFAASGALGLVSGFLMFKKQHYTIAMVALLVCVLTSITGFASFIIGLIVFIMFTKCKDEFTS